MANYTNDDYMVYDLTKHRYVLTTLAIEEELNTSLEEVLNSAGSISAELDPELFLKRVSKNLYTVIYGYNTAGGTNKTEYVMSLPDYREAIYDAMLELAYYYLVSNVDPFLSTVDNDKNQLIPAGLKTSMYSTGLLYRGDYILEPDYMDGRGEDY